jgi:hypothetical protein
LSSSWRSCVQGPQWYVVQIFCCTKLSVLDLRANTTISPTEPQFSELPLDRSPKRQFRWSLLWSLFFLIWILRATKCCARTIGMLWCNTTTTFFAGTIKTFTQACNPNNISSGRSKRATKVSPPPPHTMWSILLGHNSPPPNPNFWYPPSGLI